jgi:hypothetical protein
MQRKHVKPRSGRRSVKVERDLGCPPPTETYGLIKWWLELANSSPPLDNLPKAGPFLFAGSMSSRTFVKTSRCGRCEVCEQIFYPTRRDARCCSRKCSHIRRQHRFTGNWERYKRARAFRIRTGLSAVKGKERRRLVELNKVLRATEPEDDEDQ